MKRLQELVWSLLFLLLAAGVVFLIRFEFRVGIVGGTYGGVRLSDMPGLAAFILAFQFLWLLISLSESLKNLAPRTFQNFVKQETDTLRHPKLSAGVFLTKLLGLAVVSLLGLWMIVELALFWWKTIRGMKEDAFFTGFIVLISIGLTFLLCYLIYEILLKTIITSYLPRVAPAFLLLFRRRS